MGACLSRGQPQFIHGAYPVHDDMMEEDAEMDETDVSKSVGKQGHLTAQKSIQRREKIDVRGKVFAL